MNVVAFFLALWTYATLGQPQWRALHTDGRLAAGSGFASLAAQPNLSAGARSIWLWSLWSAPHRVEARSLDRTRILETTGPHWLEVRISHEQRSSPGPAQVIAAPVAMWRELPESYLPAWPAPRKGSLWIPVDQAREWRLRLVGEGQGSWWVDVRPGQHLVTLRSTPASGVDIALSTEDGTPVTQAWAALGEAVVRLGESRTWALLGAGEGRVQAVGLPDEQEVTLTVFKGGSVPKAVRGWPSSLPRQVALESGATLTGRVVGAERKPIVGATAKVEAWIPGTARLVRLEAETDATGRFAIQGIPGGNITATLSAPGRAALVESIDVAPGESRDLGNRTLEPGGVLRITVADEHGLPVPGATVSAGPAVFGTTDAGGSLTLVDVPEAPIEIKVSAPGYQPGSRHLEPPFPTLALLELRHGFRFKGRLLDAAGRPVAGGTLRIDAADCSQESQLSTDGTFDQDWLPERPAELSLRSPGTRELKMSLAAGSAGEVRDLGDLTAPHGVAIQGRVVKASTAEPLGQARIWLPRPSSRGPAVAWGTRDLLEAASEADGSFVLSGLEPGPITLRVEAGAYARATLDLVVEPPTNTGEPIDIGVIRLDGGARVHVHLRSPGPTSAGSGEPLARIDLRRNWLEADMLTSHLWNGEAILPHVPSGPARVSVLLGRKILCEQEIDVPAGGELGVECSRGSLWVAGRVLVGGTAAGSGLLTWRTPGGQEWGRIDNQTSPTGLRQQQTFTAGRPQVDVPVEPDGSFQTDELASGPWKVFFLPRQGSATPEIDLAIPTGERFETILPFAGLSLGGVIVSEDGKPAKGAQVSDQESGATAIAREDGSFVLVGLTPGEKLVQGRLGRLTSDPVRVRLEREGSLEALRLTLREQETAQIEVSVFSRDGDPLPGSMVFLEEEGRGTRLLVSGPDGVARGGLEPPLAPRVRVATFAEASLVLGPWTEVALARQGLRLAPSGEPGSILVRSRKRHDSVRIASVDGWDLSWLMRLLGSIPKLNPESPFRLDGLPEGLYTLTAGATTVTLNVEAGRTREGFLD